MRGRGGDHGVRSAEGAVDFLEAVQESRHSTRADGDVPADLDAAGPQRAGNDLDLFLRYRIFDRQKVGGQELAEAAVDLADGLDGDDAALQAARVDPLLDRDVRLGFELQVARFGVIAVVTREGALDVDGMRGMAFDDVATPPSVRAGRGRDGSGAGPI